MDSKPAPCQRLLESIGCSGEPGPDPVDPTGRPLAVVPTVFPSVGLRAGPELVVELLPPCADVAGGVPCPIGF